jgi:hypothetical protein
MPVSCNDGARKRGDAEERGIGGGLWERAGNGGMRELMQ